MIQKITLEGKTLTFALEWAIQALHHSECSKIHILKCIEALIRDNVGNIQEVLIFLYLTLNLNRFMFLVAAAIGWR